MISDAGCIQDVASDACSTPYTLHSTPYTLHSAPYTLHSIPFTLQSTPYTLHPTPYRGASLIRKGTHTLTAGG